MEWVSVEWSFGKDPDVMVEVWSTAALLAAVIEALLEDPKKLQLALKALGGEKAAAAADPGAPRTSDNVPLFVLAMAGSRGGGRCPWCSPVRIRIYLVSLLPIPSPASV